MSRARVVERITQEAHAKAQLALDRIPRLIRNQLDGHGPGCDAALAEIDALVRCAETLRDQAKAARVVET